MLNTLARTTRAHCSAVSRRVRVPREAVVVTYSRSSGPGGQNVNKVCHQRPPHAALHHRP